MKEFAYLVASRAASMLSKPEITQWLKERGAIHVLADVWLLKSQYPLAGDIEREITRFRDFDGPLIVLKLNEATDWAQTNLSEEANSWIRSNLAA